MKAASELIYSYFSQAPEFTAVMSQRIYPVIAEKNVDFPLSIYTIVNKQPVTKDVAEYTVDLSIYFADNQYTECTEFSEVVEQLIADDSKFTLVNSNVGYVKEDQSITATITFKIDY